MWPNSQETADLVTFTEEILNGKLHFLCSAMNEKVDWICAEIEKIKQFQTAVESKFTKLKLRYTTPVQLRK